ncbi:hypothetical protein GEMRC1_009134 [Eukaryota sp. GEM-RC1]
MSLSFTNTTTSRNASRKRSPLFEVLAHVAKTLPNEAFVLGIMLPGKSVYQIAFRHGQLTDPLLVAKEVFSNAAMLPVKSSWLKPVKPSSARFKCLDLEIQQLKEQLNLLKSDLDLSI